MRARIAFVLAVMASLAFVFSLFSLLGWAVLAYSIASGNTFAAFSAKYAPHLLEEISRFELNLIAVREYVILIGGVIGWLAFLALPRFSDRPFRELPRLLLVACLVGVVAALAIPGRLSFKLAPIATVVLILVRCMMVRKGVPGEEGREGEGGDGIAAAKEKVKGFVVFSILAVIVLAVAYLFDISPSAVEDAFVFVVIALGAVVVGVGVYYRYKGWKMEKEAEKNRQQIERIGRLLKRFDDSAE
ncbi:hypothetical protein KBTX_01626 [wastewater metagenome]|uniref:Uncharacterized protein n=2 Tax=unclassified sequences TaxID=12908 RepID=A0A5B8R968_9ZZZZ|nr:hypothetical protein [Arhodomonas sp. KWT]QEA05306.1 hypothetical protein KBTEX_01626 [uncultured organism]